MADTKLTILGMSGSGKTCYLLGMYYKMSGGLEGYSLHTDDDTDTELRKRYKLLRDADKGVQRFPLPTDAASKYNFDLQYAFQDILSFEWADYPGGDLEEKNDGDVERYAEIKKTIAESSTLFICIDGSYLCGNDIDEKIDNVRDNCSTVINHFFSEYRSEHKHIPPTAFIVTKYDECKKDTSNEEICKVIQAAFSGFFVTATNSRCITTIIPVTLGVNITDDQYSGKLKPVNIHLPIFMGIWFSLRDYVQKLLDEKSDFSSQLDSLINSSNMGISKNKSEIEKLQKEIEDLRASKSKEENRFWGRRKKYLTELTNKISELKKQIDELQSNSSEKEEKSKSKKADIAKKLSNNMEQLNIAIEKSDLLFRELDETIPFVFMNGERATFKMIAEILDGDT